jgi:aminoglycoside 6'-N-acetyltransferase I
MRQALWMGSDATTRAAEDGTLLTNPKRFGAVAYAVFVALASNAPRGFVEVSLRDDLEPKGTPVGYIEGIYVEPRQRRLGLAQALLSAAEAWCREAGAAEIAADVLDDNRDGLIFHGEAGFAPTGSTTAAGQRSMRLRKRLR